MKPIKLLRIILITTGVFTLLALARVFRVMKIESISFFQPKWLILSISIILIVILLFALWWWDLKIFNLWSNLNVWIQKRRVIRAILGILFWIVLAFSSWVILFSPIRGFLAGNTNAAAIWYQGKLYLTDVYVGQSLLESGTRLSSTVFQWWIFWICGLAAAVIVKIGRKRLHFGIALLAAFIGEAIVYKVAISLLAVSSNPFALTWQESYRLYYASLLASERLYGMKLPLSPVDFSLNLLNGIPFIVGDFPIWAHNLWQVLLSVGLATLTGWALTRRLNLQNRLWQWLLTGFLALYFLQEGGVKYNLLVCVLIVLLVFSTRHPWRSLLGILLASFWAGLSRVNWFPVPAMLGVTLYLLEEPVKAYRCLTRYLSWPALWTVTGIAVAFFAYQALPMLSGSSPYQFESVFNSRLLWYRLLPNPTYSLGVLPAVLLVSLPLWWICLYAMGRWHPIRWFGLMAMLVVLFAGGLVASVKIGGGSDLHNMDAYAVLMGIAAIYIFFQRDVPDGEARVRPIPWPAVALVLLFPIWSAVKSVQPYMPYDRPAVEAALQTLRDKAGQASAQGEVLFMYQKQLLAFGYVEVPLVAEYENVFILEMAMSQNETYLNRFYNDLCRHRFSLIVSEGQPQGLQGSSHGFGEENDAWFTAVTQPLLKTYQLDSRIPEAGLELYVPRPDAVGCDAGMP